jgi:type 1 glutamine amidotransferase
VLIVDGFNNHDWEKTTKLTREILEESDLFNISVSTFPLGNDSAIQKWNPQFHNYDVVIQNTNNIKDKTVRWPEAVEKQLENYVSKGGGLYILHSANNSFDHWKEYDRMIGLGWRKPDAGVSLEIDSAGNVIRIPVGEGRGTYHGPKIDLVIKKLIDHPINKDFPDEWTTPHTELYKYARGPAENVTVISYAQDTATLRYWPVEWVIAYDKGQVYNSSMGHLMHKETYPDRYKCVGYRTCLIRATEWLAKGETTYPIPKKFPDKDSIVLCEIKE